MFAAALLMIVAHGLTLPLEQPFFEQGIVRQAAEPGEQHCLPVIIRTGKGNLFTVWTRVDGRSKGADRQTVIVGAFSTDGGRTWGEPKTLIHTPGMGDYDANAVVAGDRVLVYSTTTPVPQPVIDRSVVLEKVNPTLVPREKQAKQPKERTA